MIDPSYARTMARYNRWQNQSLYDAASTLDDAVRRAERGAFFGSIHGTLNHLLWADQAWLNRLTDTPPPRSRSIKDSISLHEGWDELRSARKAFDETIITWADALDEASLAGDLSWHSASAGRLMTTPRALAVAHMFNHQTHHRGQVHCMLTQCGARPDDTDLPILRHRVKN